jgi:ribosomal protein L17
MVTGKSVTDKVKGDRSILERIALYIPFYRGYRARNLRRDVDREVRTAVSKMIKASKTELENAHREIIETGDMVNGRKVERIRNKVDTYNTRVAHAAGGYSGIWASIKKEEQELDAVIEFDAKLLESADALRKDTENLRNSIGEDVGALIKELERKVDSLIEIYEGRELVLKGLEGV